MISGELWLLAGSAALVGLAHTLLVPDHYLPFIVLARSERWSWGRAIGITALCGLGRVVGAVLLGLAGAGVFGALEHVLPRGEINEVWSAWALVIFGVGYAIYGVIEARHHAHEDEHGDGAGHTHTHLPPKVAAALEHESHDCSEHGAPSGRKPVSLTPWLFFVVFLLGPCKVIVLGLILPAMAYGTWGILMVAAAFGLTTMVTMTAIVVLGAWGLGQVHLGRLERHSHTLAGIVIALAGVAMFLLPHHEHGVGGNDHPPQLEQHEHEGLIRM